MTTKKDAPPPDDDYSFGVELPHHGEGYDPTWNLPTFAPLDDSAPDVVPATTTTKHKES
jgi:hypothetical protein